MDSSPCLGVSAGICWDIYIMVLYNLYPSIERDVLKKAGNVPEFINCSHNLINNSEVDVTEAISALRSGNKRTLKKCFKVKRETVRKKNV